MATAYADPATPQDVSAILAMVRRHEGEASAQIAAYWLARRPDAFAVFRGSAPHPLGFTAALCLAEPAPEECAADPAVAAAWQYVRRYGPLRRGEQLMHHRFLMAWDAYQDRTIVTLVAAVAGIRWLATPGLAWSFPTVADPERFASHFAAIGFPRAAEADFEVGGRRYGVFAHDWRLEPPLAVIRRKGLIERTDATTLEAPDGEARVPLIVLSQPDFAAAVRQALRNYHRPDALSASALLRSRVAADHAGGAPTASTLQTLLREAAASLRASPRDAHRYRALHRTYLEPAATQELAAELLGLPFNTYRYHLTAGIAHVTDWLWQRELRGPMS
jgi:hypothetical protein